MVGDVDNEERYACGEGVDGKSLYPFLKIF